MDLSQATTNLLTERWLSAMVPSPWPWQQLWLVEGVTCGFCVTRRRFGKAAFHGIVSYALIDAAKYLECSREEINSGENVT